MLGYAIKHWKHLSPVQIRRIADYCKTKACSFGVDPSIGLLLDVDHWVHWVQICTRSRF